MYAQRRLKSACASAAWRQWNCILGYQNCAQRRLWLDCANAQADQKLRWVHMTEGKFSDVFKADFSQVAHSEKILGRITAAKLGADPAGFLRGVDLIVLPYLLYVFGQTSLSKQSRPRSDAAERGVWSGSTLFATHPAILHIFIGNKIDVYKEKYPKFIIYPKFPWKWNFESKGGSIPEPPLNPPLKVTPNPLWIRPWKSRSI